MSATKKCFVIMGFGIKTDLATGRKLDLNKSYNALIKPVVKAKGFTCIRADEIRQSGIIDVVMYQELLEADVVIADLSTANPNAFYELGIRHALRPFTTIVISENKLAYPFDLNHVSITSYTHLCDVIDYDEVMRFQAVLGETLDAVLQSPKTDSPVYTYLNQLMPPLLQQRAAQIAVEIGEAMGNSKSQKLKKSETNKTMSLLVEQGEKALKKRKFNSAKAFFGSALEILEGNKTDGAVVDTYILQRLALCIYKSNEPFRFPATANKSSNHILALQESMDFLNRLDLDHTNDPETLSLAGAIEKKLHEASEGDEHLAAAMLFYQRGFYLLYNRYNGINLAYLFLCQANSAISPGKEEKIADLVCAKRMWRMVLSKCDKDWEEVSNREMRHQTSSNKEIEKLSEEQKQCENEEKFWILANQAEAHFGLGEYQQYESNRAHAIALPYDKWMLESLDSQVENIKREMETVGYLINPAYAEMKEAVL